MVVFLRLHRRQQGRLRLQLRLRLQALLQPVHVRPTLMLHTLQQNARLVQSGQSVRQLIAARLWQSHSAVASAGRSAVPVRERGKVVHRTIRHSLQPRTAQTAGLNEHALQHYKIQYTICEICI